jgi:hypothetical protein
MAMTNWELTWRRGLFTRSVSVQRRAGVAARCDATQLTKICEKPERFP